MTNIIKIFFKFNRIVYLYSIAISEHEEIHESFTAIILVSDDVVTLFVSFFRNKHTPICPRKHPLRFFMLFARVESHQKTRQHLGIPYRLRITYIIRGENMDKVFNFILIARTILVMMSSNN